jgi:hypothetical protein
VEEADVKGNACGAGDTQQANGSYDPPWCVTAPTAAWTRRQTALSWRPASTTASLSGLTIANGLDGGIVNKYGATLTVSGCTLSVNSATAFTANGVVIGGDGGGIWNAGTLTASDSILSRNSAAFGGNTASLGGDLYNAGWLFVYDSVIGDLFNQ